MPGILQTDDYIRAMFDAQGVDPADRIVDDTMRDSADRLIQVINELRHDLAAPWIPNPCEEQGKNDTGVGVLVPENGCAGRRGRIHRRPLFEFDGHRSEPAVRPRAKEHRVGAFTACGQLELQEQAEIVEPGLLEDVHELRPAPLPAASLTHVRFVTVPVLEPDCARVDVLSSTLRSGQ